MALTTIPCFTATALLLCNAFITLRMSTITAFTGHLDTLLLFYRCDLIKRHSPIKIITKLLSSGREDDEEKGDQERNDEEKDD